MTPERLNEIEVALARMVAGAGQATRVANSRFVGLTELQRITISLDRALLLVSNDARELLVELRRMREAVK